MSSKIPKNKTLTRLACVQALYLYEINELQANEAFSKIIEYYQSHNPLSEYDKSPVNPIGEIDKKFFQRLFEGVVENLAQVDAKIVILFSKQQKMPELSSIVRCILRIATGELLFCPTPAKVVIDEYVTLAREFYGSNEVSFINGVLDNIASQLPEA